jgi:hypothetical protein
VVRSPSPPPAAWRPPLALLGSRTVGRSSRDLRSRRGCGMATRYPETPKAPLKQGGLRPRCLGGDLLSHAVSHAVPSALEGLTSGFGMGPGVSPPLWPPKRWFLTRPDLLAGTRVRTSMRARASVSPAAGPRNSIASASKESSPRPISTGRLNTLPCVHLRPIYLVVSEGPYSLRMGSLILGRASHLDAFSAYPFRTWLTSRAAGATTGTPEVRPPRSSRTGGSSPQASYAHDG